MGKFAWYERAVQRNGSVRPETVRLCSGASQGCANRTDNGLIFVGNLRGRFDGSVDSVEDEIKGFSDCLIQRSWQLSKVLALGTYTQHIRL